MKQFKTEKSIKGRNGYCLFLIGDDFQTEFGQKLLHVKFFTGSGFASFGAEREIGK